MVKKMVKKILVVDDDELIHMALETLLTAKGYRVDCANGGEKALEKLQSGEEYASVILDVVMPKMDGFEVCRRIRSMESTASIPIIMLSAKNMDQDKETGLNAGADLFLSKPISPEKLLGILERVMPG